jgi:soluble lytic murein transglycosylase-like protein
MSYLGAAGPYLKLLNDAEEHYGIPTNLLVRIAYQESSFRPDVISGLVRSSAGCVGIMQLNPMYFPNAGKSTALDISNAAQLLANLHARFRDWQLAVAAYNWGGGDLHHAIAVDGGVTLDDLPAETAAYVRAIFTDVPITGVLMPVVSGATEFA